MAQTHTDSSTTICCPKNFVMQIVTCVIGHLLFVVVLSCSRISTASSSLSALWSEASSFFSPLMGEQPAPAKGNVPDWSQNMIWVATSNMFLRASRFQMLTHSKTNHAYGFWSSPQRKTPQIVSSTMLISSCIEYIKASQWRPYTFVNKPYGKTLPSLGHLDMPDTNL